MDDCRARREKLIVHEFRQLRRAEHGGVAHHQRRADLGVAMRAGMQIEHELPERAFHARQPLLQHHKTRAGQFGGQLEIHHAERLAQFEMLLGLEGVIALLAVRVMLDILAGIGAVRHIVERQIGNLRELDVERGDGTLFLSLHRRNRRLELCDLRHQFRGGRLVFLRLGLADILRSRVAPRLRLFEFGDERAPRFVELDEPAPPAAPAHAASAPGRRRQDARESI